VGPTGGKEAAVPTAARSTREERGELGHRGEGASWAHGWAAWRGGELGRRASPRRGKGGRLTRLGRAPGWAARMAGPQGDEGEKEKEKVFLF
jgi:hypothetical protein